MKKNTFTKEIEKVWPEAKRQVEAVGRDAQKLMKEGEKSVTKFYARVKLAAEDLVDKVCREELYYELGKRVATRLSAEQLQDKQIQEIHAKIQSLNKGLKKRKRKG